MDAGPAGLDKTWIRVRLADSREGWILSNLTRPLDPVWRWPTFDRIIAERLGRKGDGFAASAELVAFIERVAPEYTDPDGRGRIELARLRAMAAALESHPDERRTARAVRGVAGVEKDGRRVRRTRRPLDARARPALGHARTAGKNDVGG